MQEEIFNNCEVNLGTPDKTIKAAIYQYNWQIAIFSVSFSLLALHCKSTMCSVTNNLSLETSLYIDFLQVNNSFDVCPIVANKDYMTIIGGPGSGKTATARHIALQLEEEWEVVPVFKLEDIIQSFDVCPIVANTISFWVKI
jgi:Cdc6-like AAA superfamily ATPase